MKLTSKFTLRGPHRGPPYTYADQYTRRTKDEEKVRDSLVTKLMQGADDEKGANSRFNDSMALFAISSQQLVESNNKAWMMEVIQRIPEFDGSKPYEFLVWMDACERQAEDMRLPPLQVCRLPSVWTCRQDTGRHGSQPPVGRCQDGAAAQSLKCSHAESSSNGFA